MEREEIGWGSSDDATFTELKLEFSSKELAIEYAKKIKSMLK